MRVTQSRTNYVILYNHGNATDLGKMRDMLLDLSYTLNVHSLYHTTPANLKYQRFMYLLMNTQDMDLAQARLQI